MTHISHTAQDPNVDSVRRQLEQHLQDRLDTLADLAPPRAAEHRPGRLPDRGVESYGRRTDRRGIESAECRDLWSLHPLRRSDRSRATRGPTARCRLHRMSKPCGSRIARGVTRGIAASRTEPRPATMTISIHRNINIVRTVVNSRCAPARTSRRDGSAHRVRRQRRRELRNRLRVGRRRRRDSGLSSARPATRMLQSATRGVARIALPEVCDPSSGRTP